MPPFAARAWFSNGSYRRAGGTAAVGQFLPLRVVGEFSAKRPFRIDKNFAY
jgi:hypothetical protein